MKTAIKACAWRNFASPMILEWVRPSFSVAEFDQNGELKTVPYQQLRTRYPAAVAKMTPSEDLGFGDDVPPQQKAYLKIHDLIVQAYQGRPLDELLKDHAAAVNELLPVEGETSPAMRLNLYCDTEEILETIADHKQ